MVAEVEVVIDDVLLDSIEILDGLWIVIRLFIISRSKSYEYHILNLIDGLCDYFAHFGHLFDNSKEGFSSDSNDSHNEMDGYLFGLG